MFFKSTDEKINDLEKKIVQMEKKVSKNLRLTQSSVGLVVKTMEKLSQENEQLKKEKEKLLERQAAIERELEKNKMSFKINENIVEPLKAKLAENVVLLQDVAKQGFDQKRKSDEMSSLEKIKKKFAEKSGKKSGGFPDDVYMLYHLIEKSKTLRVDNAAWSLRVHPLQALRWCNTLQDDGFVTVTKDKNGKYLASVR